MNEWTTSDNNIFKTSYTGSPEMKKQLLNTFKELAKLNVFSKTISDARKQRYYPDYKEPINTGMLENFKMKLRIKKNMSASAEIHKNNKQKNSKIYECFAKTKKSCEKCIKKNNFGKVKLKVENLPNTMKKNMLTNANKYTKNENIETDLQTHLFKEGTNEEQLCTYIQKSMSNNELAVYSIKNYKVKEVRRAAKKNKYHANKFILFMEDPTNKEIHQVLVTRPTTKSLHFSDKNVSQKKKRLTRKNDIRLFLSKKMRNKFATDSVSTVLDGSVLDSQIPNKPIVEEEQVEQFENFKAAFELMTKEKIKIIIMQLKNPLETFVFK